MIPDRFAPAFEALPREFPIFPLPGALLLPHGRLPLNLFEGRYVAMAQDAIKADRIIGMVQPLEYAPDPVPAEAALFETGCAGRITAFQETSDGRILITLHGLCRFRIANEIEGANGYRRVRADFEPYRDDMAEDAGFGIDREALLGVLEPYFEARGLNADWSAIEEADDETLVVSLAMMCPFGLSEKQALLEAPDMPGIGNVLMTLLAMSGAEDAASAARH